jgi:nucleotide-binding universal stress UspA family protein
VGVFDPDRVGILVPTAGGPNALGATRLALGVARRSALPVRVLHISPRTTFAARARGLFRKNLAGQGIEEHLAALRALADPSHQKPLEIQHQSGGNAAQEICAEARKGCDLIVIGASQHGPLLGGKVLADVVAQAPCHVAIVRTAHPDAAFRRLLVLVDGSAVSRVAVEFAVRYCEVTDSALTLAVLGERDRLPVGESLTGEFPVPHDGMPVDQFTEELIRISPVFRAATIVPQVLHLSPQRFFKTVLEKTQGKTDADSHDLMVIGAENRAIRRQMFFGHDNERLIRETSASVAILIPHLGRLTIGPK